MKTNLNGIDLSFVDIRDHERTKHVHRLHPYLGKYPPQLVEAFLKYYFNEGDSILDPFMGSGTTLIESNVIGIYSIGLELSRFSCLIGEVKTKKYDIPLLEKEIKDILSLTKDFSSRLVLSNTQSKLFKNSIKKYETDSEYLNDWLSDRALQEVLFFKDQIINYHNQDLLKIILCRSARSARLTTHYDLAYPKKPIRQDYYCFTHHRMCQPVNEAMKFIKRYSLDTIKRIKEFDELRTDVSMKIIQGDSRVIDLCRIHDLNVYKFDGIFTSPPYVGMINYHDQHRYAYELFGFDDNRYNEIGSAVKGKSKKSKQEYNDDIIAVFQNMNRYLKQNAKIFVVVNDKDNHYYEIANACGYIIKDIYNRPVITHSSPNNGKFSEKIYYFERQ